ncbi:preprotein translocase subunit SecG [Candidatus Peribacteria bacterium RIFCSPLOWO2_02_FULL_51_10]|nr:MAG: preprotein translocase subunit SecG [Candidatus Peribacteria bacterium RIFCSPLOWO2_02_FULL_51_10]
MTNILLVIEIILGIVMTLLILIQHRASGLSATFGGTGTAFIQRRGAEKVLFTATIWFAVAFFAVAVALMYV